MDTLGLPLNWQGGGLATIILFVIFSLVKGWLIPKSWVNLMLVQKDKIIDAQAETIQSRAEVDTATKKLLDILTVQAAVAEKAKADVDGT
jgi:hypothetical protein